MKQSLIPHLHLFLDKAKRDPDHIHKCELVSELLGEPVVELPHNSQLLQVWKQAGLTFEYSTFSKDKNGLPKWTLTAVHMTAPESGEAPIYPGPTPMNLDLFSSPKDCAEILDLKPAKSGQVNATNDLWQRYSYDVGEIKCSFSDGKKNPDGTTARSHISNDGKNRFSAALSNKIPCALQLLFARGLLVKMSFFTMPAIERVDSLNEKSILHCKPCVEKLCSKRLFYSDKETLEKLRLRDSAYAKCFNATRDSANLCTEIVHEYRTDSPNIDIRHYIPDGIDRPFHTYVTCGLSNQPVSRRGPGRSGTSTRPSSPGSEIGSRRQSLASSVSTRSRSRAHLDRSMSRSRLNLDELDPNPASRIELIFYSEKPRKEFAQWLKHVGRQAFEPVARFLQAGTIIRCPQEFTLSLPHGQIENFVLMKTNFKPDAQISESLEIDGDPVSFLLVVPITTLERGRLNDLVERLRRVSSAVVFSTKRPSYVS